MVVDYHQAANINPLRYMMLPVFTLLEPFAAELCRREIAAWVPDEGGARLVSKHTYCGGLYQKVVLTK